MIVGYIAYIIYNWGIREERLIREHKEQMRAENELEIARHAETTGSSTTL
jgi:hypothetical protein